MECQIILPQNFELDHQEFVKEWNAEKTCSQIAIARISENSQTDYNIDWLITGGLVILSNILVNITSSLIYDKIKLLLEKKGKKNSFKIEQSKQKDGTDTYILIVIEEK